MKKRAMLSKEDMTEEDMTVLTTIRLLESRRYAELTMSHTPAIIKLMKLGETKALCS